MRIRDLLKTKTINDESAQRLWNEKRDAILQQWILLELDCKKLQGYKHVWEYPRRLRLKKLISYRLSAIKTLLKEKKGLEKHWLET